MTLIRALIFGAAATLGAATGLVVPLAPAAATGIPVFDAANYAESLVQAARALDQVNNQVRSLQNEASMLQGMAKNLATIDFPQLRQISSAMEQINQLMSEANGIQFRVQGLDQQVRTLFPGAVQQALTGDQRIASARARLDAATTAYRQAMSVQATVAENVQADASVLGELAATSQGAEGALQVGQAANQLMALSVKQQLQLQNLMAAEYREAAIDRARRAQAEEEGRAATRRFIDGATPAGN
ncbi:MAG TPA: P-type conjugative transfer protein TrbJ [Sphingomicrobium sp.]|nr:P-type conjugative transfer protein TrbJ [Sphingomicrobium sp.]